MKTPPLSAPPSTFRRSFRTIVVDPDSCLVSSRMNSSGPPRTSLLAQILSKSINRRYGLTKPRVRGLVAPFASRNFNARSFPVLPSSSSSSSRTGVPLTWLKRSPLHNLCVVNFSGDSARLNPIPSSATANLRPRGPSSTILMVAMLGIRSALSRDAPSSESPGASSPSFPSSANVRTFSASSVLARTNRIVLGLTGSLSIPMTPPCSYLPNDEPFTETIDDPSKRSGSSFFSWATLRL
mmetsp:Transcript_38436/g.115210  ORF Transcript_38436/g.115210 Transcript_38436/m.115210 type:complete len:239 (-) Transcript_38436:467-1183(-)